MGEWNSKDQTELEAGELGREKDMPKIARTTPEEGTLSSEKLCGNI